MKRVMTTQIGADGILKLHVPLAKSEANRTVRVTLETVDDATAPAVISDRRAWLTFIEQTAGSIADPTFERQPQGQLEERDGLP